MRQMERRAIALRLRRPIELRFKQRLGHRPQQRLQHREIDPRDAAMTPVMPQRGGSGEGEHQAAHRVEPGQPDTGRHLRMPV